MRLKPPVVCNALNQVARGGKVSSGAGHWFEIKDSSEKGFAEISIMDEIGGWGISARQLVDRIADIDDKTLIRLHLFCPGGDVLEGNEIFNALKAHKGGVDVTIGALCASIATVIACAGRTVTMAKNGLFMIHNPWVMALGESEDLRRMADIMDKMKGNILDTYIARTGKTKAELTKLMDDESWFTAQEAKDLGFINDVLEEEDAHEIKDRFNLSQFKNSIAALSRISPTIPPVVGSSAGSGNAPGQTAPAETKSKPSAKSPKHSQLMKAYQSGSLRIFNSVVLLGSIAASTCVDLRKLRGQEITSGVMGNVPPAPPEDPPEDPKAMAKALYQAKLSRDKDIDEIVTAVRKRDKKDFTDLALEFKRDDKTPDEFARAITVSDKFKEDTVIGSGIEVVGVRGLPVGTPGEAFVASEGYKALVDKIRKGSRTHASILVETRQFIAQEMGAAIQNVASTGLTSIEKLPGIVTLGVRPLTVKDLIAPGSTNGTTIRYIQETAFVNSATTVAEGAAKPAADFTLIEVDANVKKIAAYTKVTDELFADFLAVASYINMRLPYMVERTEEDQILNGNGLGNNLTGIMNFAGVQSYARVAGTDTAPDAIYKSFTKIRWQNMGSAAGGFEPTGIVVHPYDWENIRLAKDNNGQYYAGGPFTAAYGNAGGVITTDMLWGKPVVVTPAITQGTALTGAFRLAAQYFQRQGMTIESTNTDQDDFIKNLTTIRAELRLALAVYRPGAFCKVTNL